jgi:hypothetical protein
LLLLTPLLLLLLLLTSAATPGAAGEAGRSPSQAGQLRGGSLRTLMTWLPLLSSPLLLPMSPKETRVMPPSLLTCHPTTISSACMSRWLLLMEGLRDGRITTTSRCGFSAFCTVCRARPVSGPYITAIL